jgi:DNA polymerase phi
MEHGSSRAEKKLRFRVQFASFSSNHCNYEIMSLSLYKPLGDNDEATRISAAKQLSSELIALLAGERNDRSKADVEYALKRLTRGLASGRDFARPGFALVLIEVNSVLRGGRKSADGILWKY